MSPSQSRNRSTQVKSLCPYTPLYIKQTTLIPFHQFPYTPFMASPTSSHILLYPFPSSGHTIPLLDFTRRLLSRGLTVTLLVTVSNKPLLNPLVSSHPPPQFDYLVFPDPVYHPANGLVGIMRSLREQHYPLLLQWFQSHLSPPVAIISDFFLGWTYHFASQVGVKRIVFSPSGAFAFSVGDSTWQESPQNDDPDNENYTVSFRNIPNSPNYPWWQICHVYRLGKEGEPDWEFYRDSHFANMKSYGVVLNSFAELESDYIRHMKKHFGKDRVWAVGPILPPDDDLSKRGGSSSVDVLTWLDSKKDNSVVYICFGSRVVLTRLQMEVLAGGLEKSGVDFVWCVRQPKNQAELGEGFEDGVVGRGFVIKGWAPQVAILRHRAVAAFVTHCGWNSVLEGLSAGVVMLTWPMGADQYTNAQLLVDKLGVGVRVGEESRRVPKAEELAEMVRESVREGLREREKVGKMKEGAMDAVNGGSSEIELKELVKNLNDMNVVKIGDLSDGA